MGRPKVGVAALIVNNGKVLVGKRKSLFGKGTWAPPGGRLEYGEDPVEAVKREVMEETGLKVSKCEFLGVTNDIYKKNEFYPKNEHFITLWFSARVTSTKAKVMEPEKHEEWKWIEFAEIKNIEPKFVPFENFVKNRILFTKK
ncbi:MAG: NUDIX domain-containing protein [Candidatus Micrarchaeota archaeon]|nr:NUDIX domain-containing protein [Candidatus Micrarchaeota archaeon]